MLLLIFFLVFIIAPLLIIAYSSELSKQPSNDTTNQDNNYNPSGSQYNYNSSTNSPKEEKVDIIVPDNIKEKGKSFSTQKQDAKTYSINMNKRHTDVVPNKFELRVNELVKLIKIHRNDGLAKVAESNYNTMEVTEARKRIEEEFGIPYEEYVRFKPSEELSAIKNVVDDFVDETKENISKLKDKALKIDNPLNDDDDDDDPIKNM